MSASGKSNTPIVWRLMRKLNRRMATHVIGRGRGPRGVVLLLRLKRHPVMMRAMLAAEGQWRCGRADLECFAANKALVAIRPSEKA